VSVVIVDPELRSAPGSGPPLERLRRAGHDVVDRRDAPSPPVDTPRRSPADRGVQTWHLTASPEACGDRILGVTTILVGPRRPAGRGPTHRCDLEARDLAAAVLEVLVREAMPDRPAPPAPADRHPR
jgi:hypothetical protein